MARGKTRNKNMTSSKSSTVDGGVVDLFCGVGGLSLGFKRAGFKISAGVDLDATGKYAFERYTGGKFLHEDIADVNPSEIKRLLGKRRPSILIGCAPCQSFSEYNKKGRGSSWNLLPVFARIIEEVEPDIVSMENVARLASYKNGRILNSFVNRLSHAGYNVSWFVVSSTEFGISQRRKRLVLFASKRGFIELLEASHDRVVSLKDVIGHLPPLRAGQVSRKDRYHRAQSLSAQNAKRIGALDQGGTWRDWPENLVLPCHRTRKGREFGSVYGRLNWGEIGPTITTQFFKVGTGRFAHPTQLRALSLREGAMLQTFPRNFQFVEPRKQIAFDKVGRLIGNAVPVRLGQIIAESIRRHIDECFATRRSKA